jgi:ketosteroid isomerase-like protein
MPETGNRQVVESMLAALGALAIDEARAMWHDDAVWHLEDANELGRDYPIDDYLAMLGEFFARYGDGYRFHVDDIRAHGDLVTVFAGSTQPQLGTTDGLMIYRLRAGRIAEGWGIGRGADSTAPW